MDNPLLRSSHVPPPAGRTISYTISWPLRNRNRRRGRWPRFARVRENGRVGQFSSGQVENFKRCQQRCGVEVAIRRGKHAAAAFVELTLGLDWNVSMPWNDRYLIWFVESLISVTIRNWKCLCVRQPPVDSTKAYRARCHRVLVLDTCVSYRAVGNGAEGKHVFGLKIFVKIKTEVNFYKNTNCCEKTGNMEWNFRGCHGKLNRKFNSMLFRLNVFRSEINWFRKWNEKKLVREHISPKCTLSLRPMPRVQRSFWKWNCWVVCRTIRPLSGRVNPTLCSGLDFMDNKPLS